MYNSININELAELIQTNFPHFEACKDQSVVLVLGPTKAGKSTLINHMIGHELQFGFKHEHDANETYYFNTKPDTPYSVIGQTKESETNHVAAYTAPNGLVFCDCPGFFDTRRHELSILASISMEYAIKSSKKIVGIVLVIDYNSTKITNSFSEVCEIIGRLLSDKAKPSLIVALTKLPERASRLTMEQMSDYMINEINDLVETRVEGARGDPDRIRQAVLIKQGAELIKESITRKRLILSHKKQADRDALFDMLNSPFLKPLESKLFDFTTYDQSRNYFYQWIAEAIKNAMKLKGEVNHVLPEKIKKTQDRLNEIKKKIETLEDKLALKDEKIKTYKDEICDIDSRLATYTTSLENQIKGIKNTIDNKEKDKRIHQEAIDSGREEKDKLEKLTNELYIVYRYSEKKQVQNAFWEEASCLILYDNDQAPHYNVVPIGNEGGSFQLLGEIKEKGYYYTKYTVPGAWFSGKIHEPHLKVYIDKRYSYENTKNIKKIEDHISNKNAALSEINENLNDLKRELNKISSELKDKNVEAIQLGYRKDRLLVIIAQLQEDSREIKKEKEQHQSNLRTEEPICSNVIRLYQNELNAAKQNLLAQEQTHRIIYSLSSILEFPAQLSQELKKFRDDFNNNHKSLLVTKKINFQ